MCKICTYRCVPPSKSVKTVDDEARGFLATNPTHEQRDLFFEVLQILRQTNRDAIEAVKVTNLAFELSEQAINQTDLATNQTEVVMAVVDMAMINPLSQYINPNKGANPLYGQFPFINK